MEYICAVSSGKSFVAAETDRTTKYSLIEVTVCFVDFKMQLSEGRVTRLSSGFDLASTTFSNE